MKYRKIPMNEPTSLRDWNRLHPHCASDRQEREVCQSKIVGLRERINANVFDQPWSLKQARRLLALEEARLKELS